MISYSEYEQAKRIKKRNPDPFVLKMCRKTITSYEKQLRSDLLDCYLENHVVQTIINIKADAFSNMKTTT